MSTAGTGKTVRVIQPVVKIKNKNIDLSPYVKSIETYKSLKQPAGTFSVELSTKNSKDNITAYNLIESFYKAIESMDIIEIGIDKPGLMVGLVDSTDKVKTIRTDNYSRNLVIKGRDFAKLLIEDSIVYSPQLAGNDYAVSLLGRERLSFMGELMFGQSSQLFNNPICALLFILKNIPAVHIEVPFTDLSSGTSGENNNSGKLGEYFICDLKAFLGDRVTGSVVSQISGKIWNSMLLCIDENFYELFIDTVTIDGSSGKEARPCLFLRPKPYDRTTDNVIMIKDTFGNNGTPALQAAGAVKSILSDIIGGNNTGNEKARRAAASIAKNLISFNKVIYPSPARDDITFIESGSLTTYVSLSGMDANGNIPDPMPQQFQGERDVNNPDDPANKSMVIPWTWDGADSFYRTMVTNEEYHTIYDDDIKQEYLGTIDDEVINYITIRSRKDSGQSSSAAFSGYSYPLMDAYKIRKFGLRAFNVLSNLLDTSYKLNASDTKNYRIAGTEDKDIFRASEYVNNRERIFNWYRYNEILENGVLVIRGNQDIRIGDKIYMPDAISKGGNKGIYAYVQGVKNRYEFSQAGVKFETTLELVRGENPKDIEDFRSQVNTGRGSDLKLGTTYKTYDNALGSNFEGKPEDPNSHNIIKYDVIQNIEDFDETKKDNQEPVNKPPGGNDYSQSEESKSKGPRFSGYISPDAAGSRANLINMQGCCDKPFNSYMEEIADQIDGGYGENSLGTIKIDDKVFQFLEAIGSVGFPFRLEIISLAGGANPNIENNQNMQQAPLALGKAVKIGVDGNIVNNITMLVSYVLGLSGIDNIKTDDRLYSLLLSRGAVPRIVITSPNQDESIDIKLCKGISMITSDMQQRHANCVQFIF